MAASIVIMVGDEEFAAQLSDERSPETVRRILAALPLHAKAKCWGDEIYFAIPVTMGEENAVAQVSVGDLGYWPEGNCFCIFYGRTPMSRSDEAIIPASPVNLIGTIKGAERLKNHRDGETVLIARPAGAAQPEATASPEFVVRKYRRADRNAVLAITKESFGGFCLEASMEEHFGLIAGTSWSERKQEGIDFDLRRYGAHTFVAEVDGQVVGYVATRIYSSVLTGHVANMAVARQFQGIGAGKALMQAALDHFRKEGMKYARIETLEQNEKGQHIYPSFGFKEIGRQIFYFREL